jgi:hypothetical protein
LKLNRDQLIWMVRLFTGHCHLKGHLFKWDWRMIPLVKGASRRKWIGHTYPMWLWSHGSLRFRYLGQFFMEPSDYYEAHIYKVLHFIRSVGLIKS